VRVDVGDAASVEAMVAFAMDTYRSLDIAVNNAGIGVEHLPTGEYSPEGWHRVLDVAPRQPMHGTSRKKR
jgi:NAD(P)-dependent dehydrogenase (short-subunit alcohol dehydrogenase family)